MKKLITDIHIEMDEEVINLLMTEADLKSQDELIGALKGSLMTSITEELSPWKDHIQCTYSVKVEA